MQWPHASSAAQVVHPLTEKLWRKDDEASRLTAFDDPEEWAVFSEFSGSGSDQKSRHAVQSFVSVKGMHCVACALALEAALRSSKGVSDVQVSAASASATVTWSPVVTRPSVWMNAALAQGYQLLPAGNGFAIADNLQQSRLALWRWLVAGFCMMQVMMYAAPTYLTQPGDVSPDIEKLLRWASLVLSLPVVVFSCGVYFQNAWRDLRRRSISMDLPVAIGIAVTFAVSAAATIEPQGWWGREVYFDSLTMFVFFLLTGRWLEQRLRSRTAGSLAALAQRLPVTVLVQLPSGEFERVSARRLVTGDTIRVLPGEAFPADGRLIDASTFVDEALLTGESRPVARHVGASVMAGSYNVGNATLVRVEKLGTNTRYAEIIALMARAALDKPRLALLADRVAKPFLIFVLLAALGAAVYWWPTDPGRALMAAVAVLVVTCPCALSLATPTAMLTTAGLLARNGVLVRQLQAIESLAEIDTVIFDKTGTLTDASMALATVVTRDGVTREQALQWAASLAQHSLHPVSRALVLASHGAPLVVMSTVTERAGQGLEGQPDKSCTELAGLLRLGAANFCRLDPADALAPSPGAALDNADGVLSVFLADANGWVASFKLTEGLRLDAISSVAALKARGLTVLMLSGDTHAAVQQVSGRAGIKDAQGDCTPDNKLDLIRALQAKGHKVMMVGDGLNDGPPLAAAHVSVAVGAAVPLAQAQSDFVMPSAQLSLLPVMLEHAGRTLRVIRQNLAWAALYNAVCVPLALGGYLPAWLAGLGMATSSLFVIANAARLSRFEKRT